MEAETETERVAQGRGGEMTWIRWECAVPRSEVVGYLAEQLSLRPAQALGHYTALCCGVGEQRPDGRIDEVNDVLLETWAMWTGKPGRFAAAIRDWCGRGEDPGALRGWWRQRALLVRQERDRQKPDGRKGKKSRSPPPQIPHKSPGGSAGDSDGIFGGNVRTDVRTNERTTTTSTARARPGVPEAYQPDLDALRRASHAPDALDREIQALLSGQHPTLDGLTPEDVGVGIRELRLAGERQSKLAQYVRVARDRRLTPAAPKRRLTTEEPESFASAAARAAAEGR